MNKAFLCLGSNIDSCGECVSLLYPTSSSAITEALRRIESIGRIDASSGEFASNERYRNAVVVVFTPMDYEALVKASKGIEFDMGRTPQTREQGLVPIDIDVVTFNDEVKKPNDYNAYYFKMGIERM